MTNKLRSKFHKEDSLFNPLHGHGIVFNEIPKTIQNKISVTNRFCHLSCKCENLAFKDACFAAVIADKWTYSPFHGFWQSFVTIGLENCFNACRQHKEK